MLRSLANPIRSIEETPRCQILPTIDRVIRLAPRRQVLGALRGQRANRQARPRLPRLSTFQREMICRSARQTAEMPRDHLGADAGAAGRPVVQIRQTQLHRSQPNNPQRRPTRPLAKLYWQRRCPPGVNLGAAGDGVAGRDATRVPQRRWAEQHRLRKAWQKPRRTLRRRATASLSRTGRPDRFTADGAAALHARPRRVQRGPIRPSPLQPPSTPQRHHRGIDPRHTEVRVAEDRATVPPAMTDRGKQDRQATTGAPQAVVLAGGVHEALIIDGREETATR